MDKPKTKLLRVPQVAERLAVKESTIRKMIFERRLPVVRIGRTVTIPEDYIERLIHDGFQNVMRPIAR